MRNRLSYDVKHEKIDVGMLRAFKRMVNPLKICYGHFLPRKPDNDTIYVLTDCERHPSGDGRVRDVISAHISTDGKWREVGRQKTAWRETKPINEK